jgi:hypothetical protein
MNSRFTIDGSDALEEELEKTCERVVRGVREIIPNGKLQALLLGGGYGRGHGGVLKTSSGDKPYNDLEFYVCLEGNEHLNQKKYRETFHHLAEKLSPDAGLEIEFKITSRKKLRRIPPTMFTYDLACGHRSLIGKNNLFGESDAKNPAEVPLFEATRLLMNRCSGLLFAKEHLNRKPFTADDADFVGRNHAKAQLGFGDAFLTANGKYHWDCRERNARLKNLSPENKLSWLDEMKHHHDAGLEFKLHPQRTVSSLENLCNQQRNLADLGLKIWLWLETKRLRNMFTSATNYASSLLDKCPETNPLRNILINAKTFGGTSLLKRKSRRYPRERLLNSLALLLWEPAALTNSTTRQQLQIELQTNATNFKEFVHAYDILWKKFN